MEPQHHCSYLELYGLLSSIIALRDTLRGLITRSMGMMELEGRVDPSSVADFLSMLAFHGVTGYSTRVNVVSILAVIASF